MSPSLFLSRISAMGLTVALFEILHEVDQCLYSGARERVVDRGPDTAHRPMPFELLHAALRRLLDEERFKFFGGQAERYVHSRTELFLGGAAVKTGCVDGIVKHLRLVMIDLVHVQQTHLLEPAGRETEHVDTEARRGVIKRVVLDMRLITLN